MSILSRIFKRTYIPKDGIALKLAFTIGGVDYFEVENIYNLPYKRGEKAIQVYEEMRMKCDYEYLKAHTEAVNNIFTEGKKIGFSEMEKLKHLNDQLRERLYNIVDTEIVYKLASVVFFDKNESPMTFDWDYARKKIAHWKKYQSVNDFFLQAPLLRLVPYLKQPGANFQTYSEVIQSLNKIQWDYLFSLLSSEQKSDFSETKDFYVGATRQESEN